MQPIISMSMYVDIYEYIEYVYDNLSDKNLEERKDIKIIKNVFIYDRISKALKISMRKKISKV